MTVSIGQIPSLIEIEAAARRAASVEDAMRGALELRGLGGVSQR